MVPTAQDTKPIQQREKACGVKRPQDTEDKLARSLPVESHRMHLIPQQQVVMQRLRWSQLRLLSTQGLYWGLVSRSPLPSTYPIPTSEGKQVLDINCTVCMNSVGTENRPYQSG